MQHSNQLQLSIIIPSWNNKDLLKRAILSVLNNIKDIDYELIIIDDASKDGAAEMVKKEFLSKNPPLSSLSKGKFKINNSANHSPFLRGLEGLKLIINEKNIGFAGTCNKGIKIAQGKYICLMGNDVYFKQGVETPCSRKTIEHLEKKPNIGALTPKLLYPDNRYQFICRSFPSLKNLLFQTFVDLKLLPNNQKYGAYKMQWIKKDKNQEVDQIDASCSIYQADLLKNKLKGFDAENFPVYMNDVDLCYRIKKTGYKIYYYPKVFAYHDHGQTYGTMKAIKRLKNWNQGMKKFYLKHWAKSKWSGKYIILNILLFFRSVIVLITGMHLKKY